MFAYYASLAAPSDALIWVLLQSTNLDPDAILIDRVSMADIVSGTTLEATFVGYVRKSITAATVTVNYMDDSVAADSSDLSWSPTQAQALGKIVCLYDADTTSGTDANLIPVFADDYVLTTPTTGTMTYVVNAAGWGKAQ